MSDCLMFQFNYSWNFPIRFSRRSQVQRYIGFVCNDAYRCTISTVSKSSTAAVPQSFQLCGPPLAATAWGRVSLACLPLVQMELSILVCSLPFMWPGSQQPWTGSGSWTGTWGPLLYTGTVLLTTEKIILVSFPPKYFMYEYIFYTFYAVLLFHC